MRTSDPISDGIALAALICADDSSASKMRLVLRWKMLRDGKQILPAADEHFAITVSTRCDEVHPKYLKLDGTETADPTPIEIFPKKFAMIDPPREKRNPRDGSKYRTPSARKDADQTKPLIRVAVRPTKPIDCSLEVQNGEWPDDEGVGVCHLLERTQQRTLESFFRRQLYAGVTRAITELKASRKNVISNVGNDEWEALQKSLVPKLAALLAWHPLSVDRLKHQLIREMKALAGDVRSTPGVLRQSLRRAAPLLHNLTPDVDPFLAAAIVSRLFHNRNLMTELNEDKDRVETARSMLGLSGDTGGQLIDFWCAPPGINTPASCNPSNISRGTVHSSAELFGLGLSINVERPLVEEWSKEPCSKPLKITVHLISSSRTTIRQTNPDQPFVRWEEIRFDPGEQSVSTVELDRALKLGSSIPIDSPDQAYVNFSLMQSNEGTDSAKIKNVPKAPSFTFTTGEGNIEILIDTKTIDRKIEAGTSIVRGFNIYGMWDDGTAETAPYFDPAKPKQPKNGNEIRKWLVTRRYSYRRDLENPLKPETDTLRNILLTPPWMPLLPRAGRSLVELPVDSAQEGGSGEPIPDEFNQTDDQRKLTSWQFDLRTGLSDKEPTGLFTGWQPKEDPNSKWAPEKDRQLKSVTQPQRYRFWVTSIDLFDQESRPIAVDVRESDTGSDRLFFRPLRRSRMLVTTPEFIIDPARNQMVTRVKLPQLPHVSTQSESQFDDPLYESGDFKCQMLLLRRQLRRRIEPNPKTLAGAVADYPQWEKAISQLLAEGWEKSGEWKPLEVAPNGSQWAWQTAIAFGDEALGFEYMATIGIEISNPQKLVFWTQRNDSRRLQLIQEGKLKVEQRTEIPFVCDLSVTASQPLPNPYPPLPVRIEHNSDTDFVVSDPVIPASGLRRDVLLSKLLAARLENEADPKIEWADTGIFLTTTQITSIRAALLRCRFGFTDIDKEPALQLARRTLAASCSQNPVSGGNRTTAGRLSQQLHETVGFRGLLKKKWSYLPRNLVDLPLKTADATQFRIYQVRVPEDYARAQDYATLATVGRVETGGPSPTCSFPLPPEGTQYSLEKGPFLVAFAQNGQFQGFYALKHFGAISGRAVCDLKSLRASHEPSEGDVIDILLFLAPMLHAQEINYSHTQVSGEFFIPIGGGRPEIFAWWVRTISAQEQETFCETWTERFSWSVEPDVPSMIKVRNHQSGWPELDPGDALLPDGASKNPKFFPNLYVSWKIPAAGAEELFMTVERDEIEVDAHNRLNMFANDSQWESLKKIDAGKPLSAAELADLAKGSTGWLDGAEIFSNDNLNPDAKKHVELKHRLSAAKGLRIIPDENVPAFVDYWRHPMSISSNDKAMDGKLQYSYRLRTGYTVQSRPQGRPIAILSQPSAWTPYVRPEAKIITFKKTSEALTDPPKQPVPKVVFKFDLSSPSRLLAIDDEELWNIRVLIRQKIDHTLVSVPGRQASPSYRYVAGTPYDIPLKKSYSSGNLPSVEDLGIDRNALDAINLTYQLAIHQMVIHSSGEEETLRYQKDPWSSASEITLRVPPPTGNTEVALACTIKIDTL